MPSIILRGLVLAFTFVLSSALASTAHAQNPAGVPNDMVEQQVKAMTPMVTEMTRATLRASLEFYAQPSTAKSLATFSRNYFDALMGAGFTRDEAIRIVAAHGLPALTGVGR